MLMIDSGNWADIGDIPPVIVSGPSGTDIQLPAVLIDSSTGDVTVGLTTSDGTVISSTFNQGVNPDGGITMPTPHEQGAALLDAAATMGIASDQVPLADMYQPPMRSLQGSAHPPLKGLAFVNALWLYAGQSGIDPLASAAHMMNEGISGKIGDDGQAYGPWQDWLTFYPGRPKYGMGKNNPEVQAWAWSVDGIAYVHREMAAGGARGLTGHNAVEVILNGFEKPTERVQNLKNRNASYDVLKSKGSGVKTYLASLIGGPILPGVTSSGVAAVVSSNQAATAKNSWDEMMSAIQNHWAGNSLSAIIKSGTYNDVFRKG